MHPRENGRFEITRVPGTIRERDRAIGRTEPVLERYERVCFEKGKIAGPPVAAYLCPGHPLLDATIDLVLELYRDLMKCGAVLVNDVDDGETTSTRCSISNTQCKMAARPGQARSSSFLNECNSLRSTRWAMSATVAPPLTSIIARSPKMNEP